MLIEVGTMGFLWVTRPMIQYCLVGICVCVESVFSFAFAQRQTTIANETHFCDPEILEKILKNKVREIMSNFLQTCFVASLTSAVFCVGSKY